MAEETRDLVSEGDLLDRGFRVDGEEMFSEVGGSRMIYRGVGGGKYVFDRKEPVRVEEHHMFCYEGGVDDLDE